MKRSENVPAGDEGAATVAIYTAGTCFLILLAQCGHPEGKINLFSISLFLVFFVLDCLKCLFLALKSQLFQRKVTFGVLIFLFTKPFGDVGTFAPNLARNILSIFSGRGSNIFFGAGRGSVENFRGRGRPGQPILPGPGRGVHPW